MSTITVIPRQTIHCGSSPARLIAIAVCEAVVPPKRIGTVPVAIAFTWNHCKGHISHRGLELAV